MTSPLNREAIQHEIDRHSMGDAKWAANLSNLIDQYAQQVAIEASKLWYIMTDFPSNSGRVVKGGFETKELALEYRNVLERATGKTYAVAELKKERGK